MLEIFTESSCICTVFSKRSDAKVRGYELLQACVITTRVLTILTWLFLLVEQFPISVFESLERKEKKKNNKQTNKPKKNPRQTKQGFWVLYLAAQSTQDVGKSYPNHCSDFRRANPCCWPFVGRTRNTRVRYRVKVSLPF